MISPDDPRHLEQLSILETPDHQDVQFLDDRLYEYNVARTGITDGRLLAIILRDRHNNIMAGLYGWTWGDCFDCILSLKEEDSQDSRTWVSPQRGLWVSTDASTPIGFRP